MLNLNIHEITSKPKPLLCTTPDPGTDYH